MAFGLPVVVSDSVGAGPDLAYPDENGAVFTTGDAQALADALTKIGGDARLRAEMGRRSREFIADFTPERWVDGMAQAVSAKAR